MKENVTSHTNLLFTKKLLKSDKIFTIHYKNSRIKLGYLQLIITSSNRFGALSINYWILRESKVSHLSVCLAFVTSYLILISVLTASCGKWTFYTWRKGNVEGRFIPGKHASKISPPRTMLCRIFWVSLIWWLGRFSTRSVPSVLKILTGAASHFESINYLLFFYEWNFFNFVVISSSPVNKLNVYSTLQYVPFK